MYYKFVRYLVPFHLLYAAIGCSDASQFAEQVIPTSSNADPSGSSSIDPNKPNGTVTTGKTSGPVASSEVPSSEYPSTEEPAPVYDGKDPGAEQEGSETETEDDAGQSAQNKNNLFTSCDLSSAPIIAQVYELPVNTKQVPDFKVLEEIDQVCVEQLNITDRAFTEGFPGVPSLIEWFGLNMRFRLYAPSQGTYNFTLKSDDGAILSIDGKTVVNNDGLHEVKEKAGFVVLSKGYHDVELRYFQGPRYRIALELLWAQPGSSALSYIPTNYLQRPATSN